MMGLFTSVSPHVYQIERISNVYVLVSTFYIMVYSDLLNGVKYLIVFILQGTIITIITKE